MDKFSITQYGKPLDEDKYTIDLKYKMFGSSEHGLLLDFSDLVGWTFKTTGNSCTFITGGFCIFNTTSICTFTTGSSCIFNTDYDCTFTTGWNCTFNTGNGCVFTTGKLCTFSLWDINTCKFKTYDDISIILDRYDKQHYLLTKELINILKIKNR